MPWKQNLFPTHPRSFLENWNPILTHLKQTLTLNDLKCLETTFTQFSLRVSMRYSLPNLTGRLCLYNPLVHLSICHLSFPRIMPPGCQISSLEFAVPKQFINDSIASVSSRRLLLVSCPCISCWPLPGIFLLHQNIEDELHWISRSHCLGRTRTRGALERPTEHRGPSTQSRPAAPHPLFSSGSGILASTRTRTPYPPASRLEVMICHCKTKSSH
jgi:hypothetical protein